VERILEDLNEVTWSRKFLWKVFEGLRLPERQQQMLADGTSKVGPWQSAHAYGLAVDIVPSTLAGWTWSVTGEDKRLFKIIAERRQMRVPISWDPLHVEAPEWPSFKAHFTR